MPRIELEDERGRYEAVIPEEPDTRKLRILRDWHARQRLALRRLKEAGLYRGGMPRERSEG